MSTLEIRIRTAEEHDFDAVAVVWHKSASEEGVGPPKMPTVDELRQRIEAEVRKGWRLFVAVWDNEIVGMLALKTEQKVLDQLLEPGTYQAEDDARAAIRQLRAPIAVVQSDARRRSKGDNHRTGCCSYRLPQLDLIV